MTDIFTPFEKAVIAEQADPQPAKPANGRRGKRGPRRAKAVQPPKAAKQRRQRRPPADRHVVQEAGQTNLTAVFEMLNNLKPDEVSFAITVVNGFNRYDASARVRLLNFFKATFG